MVDQLQRRVMDNMNKLVEEIDRSYLRKMQGDMHRCAAACCDNDTYSMQRVHNCIQNCSNPLSKTQQYVEGEFERVQNRLQRCVMDCNDRIKDQMGPNPSQSNVQRYSEEFLKCETKCVDTYCEMLPNLEKTMKNVLSSKKYE